MTQNQSVSEALRRLSELNLRSEVSLVKGSTERVAQALFPTLWRHIDDILLVTEASGKIADTLNRPSLRHSNYQPGELSLDLVRKFSELPDYADASTVIQRIVSQLKTADVIGVFLALPKRERYFALSGVGPKSIAEFEDWYPNALSNAGVHYEREDVVAFSTFATLHYFIHHKPGGQNFELLNQRSGAYLREEPILSSDCERLNQLGIKNTADLAQADVNKLEQAFADDEFALCRLAAFLEKRNLTFGVRFPADWC